MIKYEAFKVFSHEFHAVFSKPFEKFSHATKKNPVFTHTHTMSQLIIIIEIMSF